jgi:serine/threonine protein kinase
MYGRLLGGRYRLLEAHAMGGMASVWRATDEQTGEIVAIKRLHPHLIADEGALERFRREVAAMEAVRHPNVVAVRDAVVDTDEPALVMDFVEGQSVAEMAADGHHFSEPEALGVAASVADGLAAVHEVGIVHRDLKPANVLIGDDGVVRLSDFGIAVGLMDETALTAENGVVGTLRYLAPERLAGSPATPPTDVWGLGTVLYEMLTGIAAFPATTLAARVKAASTPITRPDGLTDATWAVLARALASEPGDRYADGATMADALQRLPGVPAPAVIPPDPSAPTELIALPTADEADLAAEPAVTAGSSAAGLSAAATSRTVVPPPAMLATASSPERAPPWIETSASTSRARTAATPIVPQRPSRSALAMAGIVAVLTLALVVGMAAGSSRTSGPDAGAAAATAIPVSSVRPTPSSAEPTPVPDKEKPGKDNGKGKGNDNGDGGD